MFTATLEIHFLDGVSKIQDLEKAEILTSAMQMLTGINICAFRALRESFAPLKIMASFDDLDASNIMRAFLLVYIWKKT